MQSPRLYQFFVLDDSARWRAILWIIPVCASIGLAADLTGIARAVSIPVVALATIGFLFLAAFLSTRETPSRLTNLEQSASDPELSQISTEVQTYLAGEVKTARARFSFALRLLGLVVSLLIRSVTHTTRHHDFTGKKA